MRKGIGEVMGGKVLELETGRLERLRKEAVIESEILFYGCSILKIAVDKK